MPYPHGSTHGCSCLPRPPVHRIAIEDAVSAAQEALVRVFRVLLFRKAAIIRMNVPPVADLGVRQPMISHESALHLRQRGFAYRHAARSPR